MTIQLPEGAKSFSLPSGQTIQVPTGAKSMDLPDELMRPMQYSGGFNQPEQKIGAFTRQEIDQETQEPWKKFVSGIQSGIGKVSEFAEKIPSPSDLMIRKGLEASNGQYKEAFKDYDTQKEAISLMTKEDALDDSSKWSHVYDSFFGENKEQLKTEDRARLAKKYDETFQKAG